MSFLIKAVEGLRDMAAQENKMTTIHQVIGIIEDVMCLSHGSIEVHDELKTTLNMDSLDIVEVVLIIEQDLNVKFTDDEVGELVTVQDVINHTMVKVYENYDR